MIGLLLVWLYFIVFGICLLFRLIIGDQLWWTNLVNSLTFYWFLPMVVVLPFTYISHQVLLWIPVGMICLIFLGLFGHQLIPRRPASITGDAHFISIMTYNLLLSNQELDNIEHTILSENADIVAFQELNYNVAQSLDERLANSYPYRYLQSPPDWIARTWNGLVSCYPVYPLDVLPPAPWTARPQVCEIKVSESTFSFINIHAYPSRLGINKLDLISWAVEARERQAQAILNYVKQSKQPVILTGDFNTTDQNHSYQILTREFIDTWYEVGSGLGFTFGLRNNTFGADRRLLWLPFPRWLLRIDYIFHTRDIKAIKVRLGQWDRVSDHRPLIATLKL